MLEVLGVIFLLFICKFIYDTYITNNTEKKWNLFERSHPEDARWINQGQNISKIKTPLSIQDQRTFSCNFLANQMNCGSWLVEKKYKSDLLKKKFSENEFNELFNQLRNEQQTQAQQLNFDPDSTPAGMLYMWTVNIYLKSVADRSEVDKKQLDKEEDEYDDENECDEEDDNDFHGGFEYVELGSDANISYSDDEDDDPEDDDDDPEDIEEEEYEPVYITFYNFRGIVIDKSQRSDVIKAFGKPDNIKKRGNQEDVMSYKSLGIEFCYRYHDQIPTIIGIKVVSNFESYFPKLTTYSHRKITLQDVIRSYGKIEVLPCYDTKEEYEVYLLDYRTNFRFESVKISKNLSPGSHDLRLVRVGNVFDPNQIYYNDGGW